jgi:P-type Ca2+ transporter type 2C
MIPNINNTYGARTHSISEEKVIHDLGTNRTTGLTEAEAKKRLSQFGYNRLDLHKEDSLFSIFLHQFKSIVVLILAFAAGVSFFFRDWAEGWAIFAVIVINAVIGFILEVKALKSMAALRQLDISTARVIRSGKLKEVDAILLCPGDIIYVEPGDTVPADARIFEANQLETDESTLTGESMPVEKFTSDLDKDTVLAERKNMMFKGTSVVKGNGKAAIVATGKSTQLGKISLLVQGAKSMVTPLEKKLEKTTTRLVWIMVLLALIIFITGIIQGKEIHLMLETSIALAVAAIPEGLPIVATIALAYGMMRMARRNVIVKKLEAVETLGGTNVIFTDKTGTLTLNEINVHTLFFGKNPVEIKSASPETVHSPNYERLLQVAVLCNNAGNTSHGDKKAIGDSLEIALLQFARQNGRDIDALRNTFTRIAEEPFSSETKMMITLHAPGNGYLVAVKGAIEEVLKRCSAALCDDGKIHDLTEKDRTFWDQQSEELARKGLRVLAFAYKESEQRPERWKESPYVLIGLIGFLDPPRIEVKDALISCKEAGIRVIMVTGDHPSTALTIAETIGMTDAKNIRVISGKELSLLIGTPEILDCNVFARVSPAQKLDLINLYQEKGLIVGMTGDGVNDAPALKKADIGIAMGGRGTQMAREASDLVLKDDRFASIVDAIHQGRIIFENIRKFIIYLLSCNVSEILIVGIAGIIGLPLPLLPLQILFLNLVTDVFPALALGMGKGNDLMMKKPPRNPNSPILTTREWEAIVIYAFVLTGCILSVYLYSLFQAGMNTKTCNGIAFYSLAIAQLIHVFNLPSNRTSFFRNDVTRNMHVWLAVIFCLGLIILTYYITSLKTILGIGNLDAKSWVVISAASIFPTLIIQLMKRLKLAD